MHCVLPEPLSAFRRELLVTGCQPSLCRLFGSSRQNTIATDIEAHRRLCDSRQRKRRCERKKLSAEHLTRLWRELMHPSELSLCDFRHRDKFDIVLYDVKLYSFKCVFFLLCKIIYIVKLYIIIYIFIYFLIYIYFL